MKGTSCLIMKIYIVGFILPVFLSCNAGGRKHTRDTLPALDVRDTPAAKFQNIPPAQEHDTTPPQAITLAKRPAGLPVDTVLNIDIDDVSLEGSEVTAKYIRDTLRNAILQVFGETFQRKVTYAFSWDGKVLVKDRYSRYKVSMGDVKSDKDMSTDSATYQIDTNGVVLSKKSHHFDTGWTWSLYTAFKQNVPMILKP